MPDRLFKGGLDARESMTTTYHDQKWNLGHIMNSVYSSAICKKFNEQSLLMLMASQLVSGSSDGQKDCNCLAPIGRNVLFLQHLELE